MTLSTNMLTKFQDQGRGGQYSGKSTALPGEAFNSAQTSTWLSLFLSSTGRIDLFVVFYFSGTQGDFMNLAFPQCV